MANQVEIIPTGEDFDRKFVNKTFGMFFSDKYIHKKIREGFVREKLLEEFRVSGRYATMKGDSTQIDYFSQLNSTSF